MSRIVVCVDNHPDNHQDWFLSSAILHNHIDSHQKSHHPYNLDSQPCHHCPDSLHNVLDDHLINLPGSFLTNLLDHNLDDCPDVHPDVYPQNLFDGHPDQSS